MSLLLIAFLLALVTRREWLSSTSEFYHAVCSENGNKAIYTVDQDNSSVQCLLMKGDTFVDSGDLGMFRLLPYFRLL